MDLLLAWLWNRGLRQLGMAYLIQVLWVLYMCWRHGYMSDDITYVYLKLNLLRSKRKTFVPSLLSWNATGIFTAFCSHCLTWGPTSFFNLGSWSFSFDSESCYFQVVHGEVLEKSHGRMVLIRSECDNTSRWGGCTPRFSCFREIESVASQNTVNKPIWNRSPGYVHLKVSAARYRNKRCRWLAWN